MTEGLEIFPLYRGEFDEREWPGRIARVLVEIRDLGAAQGVEVTFRAAWLEALEVEPPTGPWHPRSKARYGDGLFYFVRRQFEAAWKGTPAPRPCPTCDVPPGSPCPHRAAAA